MHVAEFDTGKVYYTRSTDTDTNNLAAELVAATGGDVLGIRLIENVSDSDDPNWCINTLKKFCESCEDSQVIIYDFKEYWGNHGIDTGVYSARELSRAQLIIDDLMTAGFVQLDSTGFSSSNVFVYNSIFQSCAVFKNKLEKAVEARRGTAPATSVEDRLLRNARCKKAIGF